MACKIGNGLGDDEWRQTVRTLGSGKGIDRPAGIWPDLHMGWMPVYSNDCVLCPERIKGGELPYCIYNCPTEALVFGDADNPDSDISAEIKSLTEKGYKLFSLPAWEDTKKCVLYASKK
jgi:Fe-S-cluster-containing dehydrogenase component